MATDMPKMDSGVPLARLVTIDSSSPELPHGVSEDPCLSAESYKTNHVWNYVSGFFSVKTLRTSCVAIGKLPLNFFSLIGRVFLAVYSIFFSDRPLQDTERSSAAIQLSSVQLAETKPPKISEEELITPLSAQPMNSDTLLTVFFHDEDDLKHKSASELRSLLTARDQSIGGIESMEVDDKRMETLPPEIRFLKLKELTLRRNNFTIFPQEVFSLHETLESLDISQNFIDQIPRQISTLAQLKDLSLTSNRLQTLPREIGALRSLESLHLENNRLTALPDVFDFLQNLSSLHLGRNQIRELPPSLCTCVSLENLYCEENQISRLPAAIGALRALKNLTLFQNELKNLDPSIENLSALRYLNVATNSLSTLPDLDKMESLSSLNLAHNQFQKFPLQILKLPNLTTLDVSYNPLEKCPEEIFQMASLTKVYVDEEQFARWGEAIDAFEKKGPTKEITFWIGGEHARELRKIMSCPSLPPKPVRNPVVPPSKIPSLSAQHPKVVPSTGSVGVRRFTIGTRGQKI